MIYKNCGGTVGGGGYREILNTIDKEIFLKKDKFIIL